MADKQPITLDLENTKVRVGIFVAASLAAMAFTFGVNATNLENKVSALEEKGAARDAQYIELQKSVTQLLINQTQSQTQLQSIQNDVTDIKKKL